MIELGDKITFQPAAFMGESALTASSRAPVTVTGRVCYINYSHGWYRVEAVLENGVLHECFKIY